MSDETEHDPEVEQLRQARPDQGDVVARLLAARVRSALVDAEVAPVRMGRFVVLEQLGEGGWHAVGEYHGGGEHRTGKRAAPRYVHAGDPAALAETGLEFEMRWCHAALLSARLTSLHSGVDRLPTKCGVRAAARGSLAYTASTSSDSR